MNLTLENSIPIDIRFEEKDMVVIWSDREKRISYFTLRNLCPCAYCYDEFTGEKILEESDIPKDIKPVTAERVGAYAMKILWSDHHGTGIYTWEMLADKSF